MTTRKKTTKKTTKKKASKKSRSRTTVREPQQNALDKAIQEINDLHRSNCEALGDYLVKTFFDGDIKNFSDPAYADSSFDALKGRDADLDVPYSTLRMILNVQNQRAELPRCPWKRLRFSHQSRLVSVKDPQDKLKLARAAAEGRWSVKKLDEMIAKHHEQSGGNGGSGRLTPAQAIGRVEKFDLYVRSLEEDKTAKVLSELAPRDRRKQITAIKRYITRLEKLRDKLEAVSE